MARLTQVAFAEYIGVEKSAVHRMVKLGTIDLGKGLDQCRLDYCSHLREVAAGRGSDGDYDLTTERARLAHHQANEKRLQVSILEGDLISSEDFIDTLSTAFSNCRAKLLNLPTRAAQVAIGCTEPSQIESEIQTIVYEALDELAQQDLSQHD